MDSSISLGKMLLMNYTIIFLCLNTMMAQAVSWQDELLNTIAKNSPKPWLKKQIQKDLALFRGGFQINTKLPYKDVIKVQIKNGKVTTENTKSASSLRRAGLILNHLHALSQIVMLPDTTFMLRLSDGFKAKDFICDNSPIFAFSKNRLLHERCILFPDPQSLGYASDERFYSIMEEGFKLWPWAKKKEVAFWRGRAGYKTLIYDRFRLVHYAKQNPKNIDAIFSYTSEMPMNKSLLKFLQDKEMIGDEIEILDHLEYKYQLLIDGNTTSWGRAQWQLFSGTVMFKQESDNIQWFYGALEPYIHYVPFNNDCSDLVSKIEWARVHDQQCKEISKNAVKFAQQNLTYADMLYYIYVLLHEYAKLEAKTFSRSLAS